MNISSLSIERDRGESEEHIDHSEQIIVLGDDNDVSYELIQLKGKDEEEEEEEEEEVKVPLVPEIIVVKEGLQQELAEDEIPRQAMLRQRSRFQTPGKEILQSQESQEAVAVLREDTSDGIPRARVRLPETRVVVEETYGRPVVRGERVPVRAEAQGEHGEMNMGCYYLMAALDFCWCL